MDTYRGGGISRFLLALAFVAGLCVAIYKSPFIVKQLGDALLIAPEAFGMVRRVSPGEVIRLDLRSPLRSAIDFNAAGPYLVYAGDVALLREVGLGEEEISDFLLISSEANGARVPVLTVARALMPYDSPHADGRPVLRFLVRQPGNYMLAWPSVVHCLMNPCELAIVPDYTTGNEIVIWPVYALQLSILASPFLAVFYRRRFRRALYDEMRRQADAPRQQVAEDFWQRETRQMQAQRKSKSDTGK